MNKKQCCVPGCSDVTSVRHRIPVKYEEIYKEWLNRIGNDKLFVKDRFKVNRNYVVCGTHFFEECKNLGTKHLKIYSVPSVNLPGFSEEPSAQNSFRYPADILTGSTNNLPLQSENVSAETANLMLDVEQNLPLRCTTPEKEELQQPISSLRKRKFSTSILRQVNVTRQSALTPKASALFKKAQRLQKEASSLKKKVKSYKVRVRLAERYAEKNLSSSDSLDDITYKFLKSQLRNRKSHATGRRFTIDDKVFALSVFKKSGKCYRLLSKYFVLPSPRTLSKLLARIPFEPGVNNDMIVHLTAMVSKMRESDKYCCLLFDEMCISCGLQYNEKTDSIIGFEDLGPEDRKPNLADHVLVFMLRGIRRKWKQPIAFMFSANLKTVDLVRCIKTIIKGVQSTGLHIVATVCDQGGANRAAVNYLKEETRQQCLRENSENKFVGFVINEADIIPLFDPPHLLKGIRNNLLQKKLRFSWKNGTQTASWDQVIKFYDLDSCVESDFRACPKLSEEHVVPEKLKKMKVSVCAQVFSQRLSASMRLLAKTGLSGGLGQGTVDTADLLFMDRLFDSVNGSCVTPSQTKPLRCAISAKSQHLEFWHEAVIVLRSFVFVDRNGKTSVPPSVANWISTLQGLMYLWKKMQSVGFKFLPLRQLNQDPVENFFGWIRSHGVRNNNPTCTAFVSSLKTAVLNNMLSSQSIGANCEEDESVGALDCLKAFIEKADCFTNNETLQPESSNSVDGSMAHKVPCDIYSTERNVLASATATYVNGYMARSVLKKVGACKHCRSQLISDSSVVDSSLIEARAYSHKMLCYPSTLFSKIGNTAAKFVTQELHNVCTAKHVSAKLVRVISTSFDATQFTCPIHNLLEIILHVVVKMCIHTWCKNVNRILSGELRGVNLQDSVKKAARMKYMKSKNKTSRASKL